MKKFKLKFGEKQTIRIIEPPPPLKFHIHKLPPALICERCPFCKAGLKAKQVQ